MAIDPIVLISSLVIALGWGSVLFEVGRREQANIHTIDDFLLYGHGMTANDLKWTFYASNISLASIFIALSVSQAMIGLATLWLVLGWVGGLWVFWKLYTTNEAQRFVAGRSRTIFALLGETYKSNSVRRYAALFSIIPYVGSVGLEFYASVAILRVLGLPDDYTLPAALILTLALVARSSLSGFRGAVRTELLQFVSIVAGGLAICSLLAVRASGLAAAGKMHLPPLRDVLLSERGFLGKPDIAVAAMILLLPFMTCSIDAWQRCIAVTRDRPLSESNRWIRSMLIGGAVVFPILYLLPVAAGALYALTQGVPSVGPPFQTTALMEPLLSGAASLHPIIQVCLLGITLAGFVAAMMSTADTLLVAAVYVIFYDFLSVPKKGTPIDFTARTPMEHASLVLKARICMLIFALVSIIITVLGILDIGVGPLIYALFSSVIVLAVPLLMALCFPGFARGRWPSANASILLGLTSVFVCFGAAYWQSGLKGLDQAQQLAPIVAFATALSAYFLVAPFRPGTGSQGAGGAT